MLKKIQNMPVPLLPTMVGACTIANVFTNYGYTWIRYITFFVATLIVLAQIVKFVVYTDTCKKEYSQTIPASLYAGFSMLLMLLGSFYFDYIPALGKALWFAGIIIHACHICVFIYRNVLHNFNWATFVPSWFVTSNGIMVSCVVGGPMNQPMICKIITWWGIGIFTLIIPFMIYRLITKPIADGAYHTQAIVLAPSSLCVVSYMNFYGDAINPIIMYYLYFAVACAIIFIVLKLPQFFSFNFYPGFAGLTFPMAIGCVASLKFAAYLTNTGNESLAAMITQVQGIQVYLTTGIIFYVLVNFVRMFINSYKKA